MKEGKKLSCVNYIARINSNKDALLKWSSRLIISTIVLLGYANLNAQTFPAPAIEWQKSYWPTNHPIWGIQTRENSGEDWFYSTAVSKSSNVQNGFICAGYNTYVNANVNDGGSCLNYNLIDFPSECYEFETATHKKGFGIQQISFVNLDGSRLWHKNYLQGDFTKIIQCSDGNFLAVGNTRSTNNIAYNPTINTNNILNCNSAINVNHANVTKIDKDGNKIWSYIYGMEDYVGNGVNAYSLRTTAFNILEHEGSYYFVGEVQNSTSTTTNPKFDIYIMQISTNGKVVNKQVIINSGNFCTHPTITKTGSGINTKFFVAFEQYTNFTGGTGTAALYSLDYNFNTNWSSTAYLTNSNAVRTWDITINAAGEILLPVATNVFRDRFHGDGILKVFRIDASNGTKISNETDLGAVKAYDLRPGIVATSDGGFAIVTSKLMPLYTPVYSNDGNYCNYGQWGGVRDFWRTDTYIAKCNASGILEWDKTFEANTPQQIGAMDSWAYPNLNYDVKTSECMYSIVQNDDGSYTVAGNNSANFDDDYLVNINGDCDMRLANTNFNVLNSINNTYTLTTNETWSSSKRVKASVVIPNGKILTINGTTTVIEFADSRKTNIRTNIVVQPGGRLIINDAKLTSLAACVGTNSKWDGILVEGNPTIDQLNIANQGWVQLTNATIENSLNAISTSSYTFSSNLTANINWAKTGGGIINATNCTFKNNKRHIELMAYKRPLNASNLSFFSGCTFELAGSQYINTDIAAKRTMVTAWGVKGVRFSACTFKNTNGALNAEKANTDRGTGIYALDASLIVEGTINNANCAITYNGIFDDLTTGIQNVSYAAVPVMSIYKYLNFTKNDKSIWMASGNTATIHNNRFYLNVPNNYYNVANGINSNAFNTGIVGVFAKSMGAYVMESNYFNDALRRNKIIVGTILDNSDNPATGGKVRLNQYEGVAIGSQTQFNNNTLSLTCNNYTNIVTSAIHLNPNSNTAVSITPKFGLCGTSGNPASINDRKDYKNEFKTNPVNDMYNYLVATKTYVVEPNASAINIPTKLINVKVDFCSGFLVSPKEPCTVTPSLSCTKTVPNPNDAKVKYTANKTDFNKIVDFINTNSANLTTVGLQDALDQKDYYDREMKISRGEMLWTYTTWEQLDSTVNATDSIIEFLINETDLDSRKLLVATYYSAGNYTNAIEVLNLIVNDGRDQANETTQFIQFYTLILNAAIDSRNIYQFGALEYHILETIAASNTAAAESAKGILILVKERNFDIYIERDTNNIELGKMAKATNMENINKVEQNNVVLNVYPNPSNSIVNISYTINELTENTTISLLDITGKQLFIQSINDKNGVILIDTFKLNSGFYFVHLSNGKTLNTTSKIIITH
jgi:hypothetical protein